MANRNGGQRVQGAGQRLRRALRRWVAELGEQVRDRQVETVGEAPHAVQARRERACLHAADALAVDAAPLGEGLLAQAELGPALADDVAEPQAAVLDTVGALFDGTLAGSRVYHDKSVPAMVHSEICQIAVRRDDAAVPGPRTTLSATAVGELVAALADVVGPEHVLTDPAVTATYETDASGRFGGQATAVVRPASADQVGGVLAVCARSGLPVVVQGGGTGLVGGGVPAGGEVVLSTRGLDGIGPVREGAGGASVVVGAGATLAAVQHLVRPLGWDVGVDIASRDSATVGGMTATNAGGARVVRHGPMRDQVEGLRATLADGSVVGRLDRPPKDATGYDLQDLLVGSEGTLGVLTEVRLRLVRLSRHRAVALVAVDGVAAALDVLTALRSTAPAPLTAAELMLADGFDLVVAMTGVPGPMPARHPAYLLVEVSDDGDGQSGPMRATGLAAGLADALDRTDGVRDAVLADDAAGIARLWTYREAHTEAVARAGQPVKLDVCVPLPALAGFVDELGDLVGSARAVVFGHLAEGNLHVNVLGLDPADTSDTSAADAVTDAVLRRVADLGGSISAEHGVGRAKVRWLGLSRTPAELAAMRAVKQALDPTGLLAPGVLLPAGVDAVVSTDPQQDLVLRHAEPADHARVVAVVDDWWGGRSMAAMLPRLFFVHFRPTSFVLEQDGRLAGFLCGFVSQTDPTQAYVHFVGVDPALRGRGAGRLLYDRFFATVRELGCTSVSAVTSPMNRASVAFHTAIGFTAIEGGGEAYDGPGEDRVRLVFRLDGVSRG